MPASSLCDESVDHLVDIMAGEGPAHLVAHAQSCPTCQRRIADMQLVAGAVRAMPQVALPDGFDTRLTQELLRRAPGRPRVMWWQALVGGMALAAAVAGVIWWRAQSEPSVEMGLAQRVEMDIAIDSIAAREQVEMHVTLPAGVSVASLDPAFDGAHTLDWTTHLGAGVNHFPLLLKPDAVGAHRVHVNITAGNEAAAMDVVVRVQQTAHATNTHVQALPVLALRDVRGMR